MQRINQQDEIQKIKLKIYYNNIQIQNIIKNINYQKIYKHFNKIKINYKFIKKSNKILINENLYNSNSKYSTSYQKHLNIIKNDLLMITSKLESYAKEYQIFQNETCKLFKWKNKQLLRFQQLSQISNYFGQNYNDINLLQLKLNYKNIQQNEYNKQITNKKKQNQIQKLYKQYEKKIKDKHKILKNEQILIQQSKQKLQNIINTSQTNIIIKDNQIDKHKINQNTHFQYYTIMEQITNDTNFHHPLYSEKLQSQYDQKLKIKQQRIQYLSDLNNKMRNLLFAQHQNKVN